MGNKVYCLCQDLINEKTNHAENWDVFGIYSTMEKAIKAKEWLKRDDGTYDGCAPKYRYNRCIIVERIIDYNLPEEEDP